MDGLKTNRKISDDAWRKWASALVTLTFIGGVIAAGLRFLPFSPFAERQYSLTVPVEPADAAVWLLYGKATYSPGVILPAGRYTVIVAREGYQAERRIVEITDGPVVTDPVVLEPSVYPLYVEVSPDDAEVRLPDTDIPYEPGVLLPAGHYRVTADKPGYRTGTAEVEITSKPEALAIELEAVRYAVTVETTPEDAEVRMPDLETDYEPGIRLPPGQYRIEVTRDGYEPYHEAIAVTDADLRHAVALKGAPVPEGKGGGETMLASVDTHGLTIRPTPAEAIVKIMNIVPVYQPGIQLPPGRYHVRASHPGFETHNQWVEITDEDRILTVDLNPLPKDVTLTASRHRRYQVRSSPRLAESKGALALRNVRNDFVVPGNGIVYDRATGLMWEKSGSSRFMNYGEARKYVRSLNQRGFGGFRDWRLPTLAELWTLKKQRRQRTGFYMDPVFGRPTDQWYWCWSADQRSARANWGISFKKGYISYLGQHSTGYVRAVRTPG